jgi:hypothetical protein
MQTNNTLKNAKSFLGKLGLSYDTLSPVSQKYLLDLQPSNSGDISGSIVSHKFNNKISSIPMSGGRISNPIEFFGVETNNYHSLSTHQNDFMTTDVLARVGLDIQTGGKSSKKIGLLKYKDYDILKNNYEKKFLRKLSLKELEKKALIDNLNYEINTAVIKSIKEHKHGKLTKTLLNKNLK